MRIEPLRRVSRSGRFAVSAPPERVFPLFCPVLEADWLESWDPEVVWSDSGVAERGCAFVSSDANGTATWLITHFDPARHTIELVKFTPGLTACQLEVEIEGPAPGRSEIGVTYSHTAIGPAGEAFVAEFSEERYAETMKQWRAAIEHYLETGEAMPGT